MAAPLHHANRTPHASGASSPRLRQRRPFTALETLRAMVVAFVVAALLGSGALLRLAEQQPYGTARTVEVALARANDRLANAFSLNRPADAIDAALGRGRAEPVDVEALAAQRAAEAPAPATTIPLDVNPETGRRWITVDQPLRLLLAGDSMMRELGSAISTVAPSELTRAELDYRVSSGLSRPDFFDWPTQLAQLAATHDPEAVVLLFGTNDFQNLAVDGAVLDAGSPAWIAEYSRRVGLVMDLLRRGDATVHWVALPPMRSAGFDAGMAQLNEVYRQQAATRPWVAVVELAPVLGGSDGAYAAHLPGADGTPESIRQEDGVHFSRAGANRAAAAVWADVVGEWGVGD